MTHTFAGWGLGRAGLRHWTPLAVPTLVVAANAPDVDVIAYLRGEHFALSFRRGWTHGVLAWVVLPPLVAGGMLLWDRWVRRRRAPGSAPARAGPLLALALLGVLTHPLLDWLNTYGIRPWMPFDDRWLYGDALFIVDPWLWLLLGGGIFLGGSGRALPLSGWLLFWGLATAMMMWAVPPVPSWATWVWGGALGLLLAARWSRGRRERRTHAEAVRRRGPAPRPGEPPPSEPGRVRGGPARAGVLLGAAWIATMILLSARAESDVHRRLRGEAGSPVREVMAAPTPADPLSREVVVVTGGGYRFGTHDPDRGFRPLPGFLPARASLPPTLLERALEDERLGWYLSWSRFPVLRGIPSPGGDLVRAGDARYLDFPGGGGLSGLVVHLPPESP